MAIRSFIGLIFVLLAGCAPVVTATPPGSPQPMRVALTPVLQPLLQDSVHRCTGESPSLALILEVIPSEAILETEAEIRVQIGEPGEGFSGTAYQLGWMEIQLIAHPDLVAGNLNIGAIREAYTAHAPAGLQPWTYPEGNELRPYFDEVILESAPVSPAARIAANPERMLEEVAANPGAIGYVPATHEPGGYQVISIDPEFEEALRQPILALVTAEPEGAVRNFLICLQNRGSLGFRKEANK